MVHASVAYAKMRDRLAAFACTASTGPGSTNMITGAALATTNRLPVLLLPSDMFATRAADPVLQQLEDTRGGDVTVNDTFRTVSKYFDRISRPEQLIPAGLAAMRVLTDPVETGAVTLALPQDVQAEAYDWPLEFFRRRVWHVGRPVPEAAAVERAALLLRQARKPLVVAGGGAVYSGAETALRAFAEATGIPVADTHAARARCPGTTPAPSAVSVRRGRTRRTNWPGRRTWCSVSAPGTPTSRPRATRSSPTRTSPSSTSTWPAWTPSSTRRNPWWPMPGWVSRRWRARWRTGRCPPITARSPVDSSPGHGRSRRSASTSAMARCPPRPRSSAPSTTSSTTGPWSSTRPVPCPVTCSSSGGPGTPRPITSSTPTPAWATRSPPAVGAKMADPTREVVVLVGDGSYLMMAQEIVTMISEGLKVIVVLVQNHGFASIGALSESLGSQRFGTKYRYRDGGSGLLDGEVLPVDLAANASSLGADVLHAASVDEFRSAMEKAKAATRTTVVHVETDLYGPNPPGHGWWDVPVSEVAALDTTRAAYATYVARKQTQRHYL